jgi:predicted nuclease with TOPRIM domain
MREEIQARLEALKKELETGQTELQKVEVRRTYLHETTLRISGAVQVLEELLKEEQLAGQNRAAAAPADDGSPGPQISATVHEGSTTDP